MADETGSGKQIKKLEKNSLQKFKNQNKVLKKFGKVGLKVYRAIRKRGIGIPELLEKTKIEQEKLFEILVYLKEKKMIETVGKIEEPVVDEETEMIVPEGPMGKVSKEEKEKVPPATIAPEGEIVPEEKKPQKEIVPLEEKEHLAPSGEMEDVPLEEEEEVPGKEEISKEEEEIPEEEVAGEKELVAEKDEDIVPLELGEEEEIPEEEEEIAEEEEDETAEDEIIPQESLRKTEENEGDDEDIFLTPGERKIKAEYGQVGIDVYNLIDGQRTAEEIMKSTGVTETKLIEMLDFMEKKGIIKLEHPSSRKPASSKKPAGPSTKEIGFAPMLEERPMPAGPLKGELGKQFTLDVPSKIAGNIFKEMQMKANVMIKYRQGAVKAYELMNGSRDAVEIALKTGLPLYKVYKVMNYLKKEGAIKLNAANRDEIRKKYGEDGYSVYKKYGREGIMLYQLVGKDMDLREMARHTSTDKQRVVQIFLFIHKLLGIDLPIDEDILLERLEEPVLPQK